MNETLETGVESKHVEVDVEGEEPVDVRYLAAGDAESDGPPVVLLHGVGMDAANVSWRYALPAFGDDHRVIAPDFPGYGESEKPNREYTNDYYLRVLDGLLDALDIGTVKLVGISMGGAVAIGHALENTETVEQLALVDSYGLGHDALWRPGGYTLLRMPGIDGMLGAGLLNPAVVAGTLGNLVVNAPPRFVADVTRSVGPAAARAVGSWQRHEFRVCGLRTCYLDRLDELTMPTLLVHGHEDPLFPVSWSMTAHERLPDSRLTLFEACGHWPPREYPEKFNRVVGSFL